MKLKYPRKASASILALLLIFSMSDVSLADSLAGKVGDKRFSPTVSLNPKDACRKTYNAYIAASGHSAYATTPHVRIMWSYIICGAHLNAPSQRAAEALAMKSCQGTRNHYKVTNGGACEIAASK